MTWINIEDETPNLRQEVWIYTLDKVPICCTYEGKGIFRSVCFNQGYHTSVVRAWHKIIAPENPPNSFFEPKKSFMTCMPQFHPTFEGMAMQMRINQEIVMKEISDHADAEILRVENAFQSLVSRIRSNF